MKVWNPSTAKRPTEPDHDRGGAVQAPLQGAILVFSQNFKYTIKVASGNEEQVGRERAKDEIRSYATGKLGSLAPCL